jgi:hypothetical protein
MKQRILYLALFSLTAWQQVFAYDFEVNGIYYGLNSSTMTVYVTGKNWNGGGYSGDIVIPPKVTYNTKELDVTAIGQKAFYGCDITSISIPNSVTSIEESSFQDCKITSINLPNNLTTIGKSAFSCSNIISIVVPNSVERIDKSAFSNCKDLESCILSEKIEEIYEGVFANCENLQDIDFPSGVKRIKYMAFRGCNSLKKLVIPSNVTTIEDYAFFEVSSITEEIIEDSETPLYVGVYNNDMEPSNVYIGREVEGINILGWGYETIYSNIIDPKPRNKFWNTVYVNCKLYIPVGTLWKYQSTDGWKEFFQIIEDDSLGEYPSNLKCSKPTISYSNGKLIFKCEPKDAICQTSITDTDIKTYCGNEIQLGVTYVINVYATKAGYENSETVTATLCWIDQQPTTEGITNEISQIPAKAVLIQSQSGMLTIQGVDDGSQIAVYTISGQMVGSTKANGNQASLATNIKMGEVAIIKIGEKSVKVVMQ